MPLFVGLTEADGECALSMVSVEMSEPVAAPKRSACVEHTAEHKSHLTYLEDFAGYQHRCR